MVSGWKGTVYMYSVSELLRIRLDHPADSQVKGFQADIDGTRIQPLQREKATNTNAFNDIVAAKLHRNLRAKEKHSSFLFLRENMIINAVEVMGFQQCADMNR